MKMYNRTYRERRSLLGLCIDCGKKPAIRPGKAGRCQECRDEANENAKTYLQKIKKICYAHYGNECTCCGESEPAFLSIDHIDNDGAEHRREQGTKGSGTWLYLWLIRNNFPTGFQILCWNCQWGKQLLGICPHKDDYHNDKQR